MTTLTVAEVAKKIDRTDSTVRQYIRQGKLPAEKLVNDSREFKRGWRIQYRIKLTDVDEFLRRREVGEFRRRYNGNHPGAPKKGDKKMTRGRDYTYVYFWVSQERATELCRILDAKERRLIFEYFYWLKRNRLDEYKKMIREMEGNENDSF